MGGGFDYKDSNMPTEKASPPKQTQFPKAILFFIIVATGRSFSATSAELKKEYDRWVHRSWTTENGLPQNTVYALAQARDGCLWIGSDGGLARFDGGHFTVFKKNSTLGLMSDSVTALCPGVDGSLWIGTFGGGLLRYRQGKFTRIEGLDSDLIWSIYQDDKGTLWIGTADDGAYCLEENRDPALVIVDGIPVYRVTATCGDGRGDTWIGTPDGLLCNKKGKRPLYTARRVLAGSYVYCLFVDSRRDLWVGTTAGVVRINERGSRTYTTANGLADNLVRAIGEDGQGLLWIGTEKGVTILEPGERPACATTAGLAGESVMAICRDREGDMWIGTSAGGLHFLKKNEVRTYSPEDGLSSPHIQPVCEDPKGGLWAGTADRGLNLYSGRQWRSFSRRDGLASDAITSLATGRNGRLWIGTRDSGLQCLHQGKFTAIRPANDRADGAILSLFEDHEGTLWIGGAGNRLNRLRNGDWRHYGLASGLKSSEILALNEDRLGNLLAGSSHDGLHVLRRGGWQRFTTADGLAGDTVYAIYVGRKNNIWLGTNGGLSLLRQGKLSTFRAAPGPLNGTILQILEDDSGVLWMSSPAGIFRAGSSELEGFSAGGEQDPRCRWFTEMEGLKSTVCAGGFQPAGCKSRDGRLWFPTRKGLAMIDPKTLKESPPPVAWIEKVQADGRSAPLFNAHHFPAGTGRFDFFYTAAAFADPQQVEFSTRLDGLEDRWSPPAKQPSWHVADLPAGTYVFQVRARSQAGPWSINPARFCFTIHAYFHQTAWFYLMLLAGVGAGAWGLLYYRRRKDRQRREEKYKSSPLGANKTLGYVHRLDQVMEKDKPYLDPELNLGKLAEVAAIPAKHLSQVINERYGLNFNDFVNRFRVEEAKRRLLDPAARDFKLLRIAFESGFNSKSVFNGAFRHYTGLSPSEFRRLLGGKGTDSGS
jgi:ligand-binding sensor domain-containing protein/AraC-like DNA-binding protein